ncbi:UDP-N-acetylglucosamine--peptide N-acetylglucosaminyltransferase, family GT41 [Ectocarpus siliculosus]|uniref:UDP-N-acetylglucosamine--peptide N-acetylglucosaminyltransferase, family GT41 n=1 Tax=Ectocarpus siliculosus TaxID=2880 RepID=D7FQ40_ECTSI|nr:UDP-N-acetylglucosamine--peptide N-acetylglucosaminyltransferase, family GT41 [Ectocarpus siliculosus]|eukprot:CBJ48372.1 UDP-N-acetylglucosamine--peptide N-acetylglucosaminyltransferase, family GT41 [Ectocarpus siliculosus]
MNLAALFHRYGDIGSAIEHYRRAAEIIDPSDVDMMVMLRARKASCDWRDWERDVFDLKYQVDVKQLAFGRPPSLLPFDTLLLPHPVTPAWRRRLAEAHSARYVEASTALVGSRSHEAFLGENRTRDAARPEGSDRRTDMQEGIGVEYDGRGEVTGTTAGARIHGTTRTDEGRARLKIGFIGHDFDEHPTAHMIEGVFVWQKRLSGTRQHGTGAADHLTSGAPQKNDWTASMVETNCCSYGGGGQNAKRTSRGDGGNSTFSRARESIRSCASSFVDLYADGHRESVERIRADGVDILVDLQGHTLGGRGQITAARPALVQVNYLVFPGTSGAPYIDYLLGDRHVTPPEHARDFSESLVLLPRTYQANLYEGLAPTSSSSGRKHDRAVLRRGQGLPGDLSRAVFANFNKVDKLDPESFSLWMQILRRVPGSVLWLLEASAVDSERAAIRTRLRQEAESQGVDGGRIVWAKWVSKSEHLSRHALADLFLDTLTYGAHSTATDALAGGLPLLTLAGASFASRVGISLLRNAGPSQSALLVAGQREFEDLAVDLVCTTRGRKVLHSLRASLSWRYKTDFRRSRLGETEKGAGGDKERAGAGGAEPPLPIFDTEAITKDLNRAFMLMSDTHDVWKVRGRRERWPGGTRLPHIVLTGKSLNGGGRHSEF